MGGEGAVHVAKTVLAFDSDLELVSRGVEAIQSTAGVHQPHRFRRGREHDQVSAVHRECEAPAAVEFERPRRFASRCAEFEVGCGAAPLHAFERVQGVAARLCGQRIRAGDRDRDC